MTNLEQTELIARVVAGETELFESLVLEHQTLVYNLALRMMSNPADAEDCAQEAFVKAYRSLPTFRGEASFSSWLYRLTTNVCLDALRAKKRRAETSLTAEDENGEEAELSIPDPGDGPEATAEKNERRALVHRALRQLPEDFRQVLLLRELGGLSYDEIGHEMQLEAGTVKSRIFRARKKLAELLRADGNFSAPETSDGREVR